MPGAPRPIRRTNARVQYPRWEEPWTARVDRDTFGCRCRTPPANAPISPAAAVEHDVLSRDDRWSRRDPRVAGGSSVLPPSPSLARARFRTLHLPVGVASLRCHDLQGAFRRPPRKESVSGSINLTCGENSEPIELAAEASKAGEPWNAPMILEAPSHSKSLEKLEC